MSLANAVAQLDRSKVREDYTKYNELVWRHGMLPPELVDAMVGEANALRPRVVRKRVPGYKKSGSVSAYHLLDDAPHIRALYTSPVFTELLAEIAGVPLLPCPDDDPHACALYYYSEPGDNIGFHYDTSHYRGDRYTVLVGLVNESASELVCHPYRKIEGPHLELRLATDPGTLVFFNGGNIWHSVSPVGEAEERIVLTLEYVTDPTMSYASRLLSMFKDAFTYFGFRQLFAGRKRHTSGT